ncbi:MAG TPA: hypothetical protein VGO68_17700 [Pyrinomonadaceae bacterium]|jgi:hypothetical protein|nr:hypothetical protein [Pyrinomonadaceae bacterium]
MMKNLRKVTGSLLISALIVTMWWSAGKSQDKASRPTSKSATAVTAGRVGAVNKVRELPPAEKLVLDVYARLMRYQSAAVDEAGAKTANQAKPSEYLSYDVRAIRSGLTSELTGRRLSELVTSDNSRAVRIKRVALGDKEGTHAFYEAAWAPASAKKNPDATVNDLPGITDFDSYTRYRVKVSFQGQEYSYLALLLYQSEQKSSGRPARVRILDYVTSDINDVYGDEAPRVRSPWQTYVKTSLYQAVVRTLREARDSGAPLLPASAPIGYLPGDDAAPNDKDSRTMALNTSCSVTITLTATGVKEVGKPTHYISLKAKGRNNVTITAALDPATSDPAVITWTGGTAGSDNLHRLVSLGSVADTDVTATVGVQSASVKIHVLDASAPPTNAAAPKTFTLGGASTVPNDAFGLTVVEIGDQGVVAPVYHVDPFFSNDRWVFQLKDVAHSYKTGTHSLGSIDLPVGNPTPFPLVPLMNLIRSHAEARTDLDTTGRTDSGPRRRYYWVEFITQNHEQEHVNYFYSAAYWQHYMGLFESDDVEDSSVSVVYDCNDNTTTTGAAAVTKKKPGWDTAIVDRHDAAYQAHFPTAESHTHGVTNPQYAPIRNAIPNP